MEILLDAFLALISGTACFFCYTLNNRLKKFADTKSGLGSNIISMTKAIDEAQANIKDLTDSASSVSAELRVEIEAALALQKETQAAQQNIDATLNEIKQQTQKSISELEFMLDQAAHFITNKDDQHSKISFSLKQDTLKCPLPNSFPAHCEASPLEQAKQSLPDTNSMIIPLQKADASPNIAQETADDSFWILDEDLKPQTA